MKDALKKTSKELLWLIGVPIPILLLLWALRWLS